MPSSPPLHRADVAAAAAAYRRACDGDRDRAAEVLALAIRRLAETTSARFPNVRPPIREEIVQERTARLVAAIRAGRARPGREDGLVRTAIKNALRDQLRRQRRDALEHPAPLDQLTAACPVQSEAPVDGVLDLLDELTSEAAREVLRWTLVEERPLAELVERDLRADQASGVVDPSDAAAAEDHRRKLRNRRDKQWQRGRDALLRLVISRHRAILRAAPPEIREILIAVYLERRKPDSLLGRGPLRARADVDATLDRARLWFLRRLLTST